MVYFPADAGPTTSSPLDGGMIRVCPKENTNVQAHVARVRMPRTMPVPFTAWEVLPGTEIDFSSIHEIFRPTELGGMGGMILFVLQVQYAIYAKVTNTWPQPQITKLFIKVYVFHFSCRSVGIGSVGSFFFHVPGYSTPHLRKTASHAYIHGFFCTT